MTQQEEEEQLREKVLLYSRYQSRLDQIATTADLEFSELRQNLNLAIARILVLIADNTNDKTLS